MIRVMSGGEFVFVDESAESVAAADGSAGRSHRCWAAGWGEIETAVRSCLVVVVDVLGEGPFEVTSGDHEEMVETVSAHGAHPSFGERVGLGARTGVRMTVTPIDATTASKLAVNFVSRSRIRNRGRRPAVS